MRRCTHFVAPPGELAQPWTELLLGAVMAADPAAQLTALNPYLPPAELSRLVGASTVQLLRATRIAQIDRCAADARGCAKLVRGLLTSSLAVHSGGATKARMGWSSLPKVTSLFAEWRQTGCRFGPVCGALRPG